VETSVLLLTRADHIPCQWRMHIADGASSQLLEHSLQAGMRSSPAPASLSADGDIDCWARETLLTRTSHKGAPGGWSNNDLTRLYADANQNIGAATRLNLLKP
jgi:hypothetical protein